jgi:hypothetical protein
MREVLFDSPLTNRDVLARLEVCAHEWRESALPRVLRDEGCHGVRIKLRDASFRIQAEGGRRRPYVPVLIGRVDAAGAGSRIRARFAPATSTIAMYAATLACVVWLSAGAGGVLSFVVGALMSATMFRIGVGLARKETEGLMIILRAAAGIPEPIAADK